MKLQPNEIQPTNQNNNRQGSSRILRFGVSYEHTVVAVFYIWLNELRLLSSVVIFPKNFSCRTNPTFANARSHFVIS